MNEPDAPPSPGPAVDAIVAHLDREDPGEVIGVYLYGSAASSGLRPDSDVDLLVLTRRSLTPDERAALVRMLLRVSGWRGHAETFPDAASGRPMELTSLVAGDLEPLPAAPIRDFQFGEWLRADLVAGALPSPEPDPDVVILLATAHTANRTLRGPDFAAVAPQVPHDRLSRAMLATIPDILGEIDGDERNTLLVLARMIVTLETGRIVPKAAAANAVAERLGPDDRRLLLRARDGYLGVAHDDWDGAAGPVTDLVHRLADRVLELGDPELSDQELGDAEAGDAKLRDAVPDE